MTKHLVVCLKSVMSHKGGSGVMGEYAIYGVVWGFGVRGVRGLQGV